jgi:hypothetical protein
MLFVTFKEKSHGRILLARLADRFRSPWKQTSEETMELVFRSSDSPIFPLDLLCPIVMYLKGTILLYKSYLPILLVGFVGTARSSSVVRVNGQTVIVLPLPVAWSLALELNRIPVMAPILAPILGPFFLKGRFSLKNRTYCPLFSHDSTSFKNMWLLT